MRLLKTAELFVFVRNYSMIPAWGLATWSICGWSARGWAASAALFIFLANILYLLYTYVEAKRGVPTETDSEQG